VYGGDWLYFDPDKKHARLNIKGIAKSVGPNTLPIGQSFIDHALMMFAYSCQDRRRHCKSDLFFLAQETPDELLTDEK